MVKTIVVLFCSVSLGAQTFRTTHPRTMPARQYSEIQAIVAANDPRWVALENLAYSNAVSALQPTFHITTISNAANPVITLSVGAGGVVGESKYLVIGGLTGPWSRLNQRNAIYGGYSFDGCDRTRGCIIGTLLDPTHIQLNGKSVDTTSFGSFAGQDAVLFDLYGSLQLGGNTIGIGYEWGNYASVMHQMSIVYQFTTNPTHKVALAAKIHDMVMQVISYQLDWGILEQAWNAGYNTRNLGQIVYEAAAYAHDVFSATELARMAKCLKAWSDWLQNGDGLSVNSNYAPIQSWPQATATPQFLGNYFTEDLMVFLLGSIELFNDDTSAVSLFSVAKQQFDWAYPPMINPPAPGSPRDVGAYWTGLPGEGVCYGRADGLWPEVLTMIGYEAAVTDGSISLQNMGAVDWFKRYIKTQIYNRRPDGWGEDQTGEASASLCGVSDPGLLGYISWYLGPTSTEGAYGRWFYRYPGKYPAGTIQPGTSADWYMSHVDVLWDRPAYVASDYQSQLPPYYYDGEMQAIWKSGWGTNDVMWSLYTGKRWYSETHAFNLIGSLSLWRGTDGVLPKLGWWQPQYGIQSIPGPNSTVNGMVSDRLRGAENTLVFMDQDGFNENAYNPIQQWTPSLTDQGMYTSVNYSAIFGGNVTWWNRAVAATGSTGGSAMAVVVDRIRMPSVGGLLIGNTGPYNTSAFAQVTGGLLTVRLGMSTGAGEALVCAAGDPIVITGTLFNGTYHCDQIVGYGGSYWPIFKMKESVAAPDGLYCLAGFNPGHIYGTFDCSNATSNFNLGFYAAPRLRWNFNVASPNTRVAITGNTATNTVGNSKIWLSALTPTATMRLVNTKSVSSLPVVDQVDVTDSTQNNGLDMNLIHVIYADSASITRPPDVRVLVNDLGNVVIQAGSFITRFSTELRETSERAPMVPGEISSFTSTFAGTGKYLIGQMRPGIYTVTLDGKELREQGSPFTVSKNGSLSFSARSGDVRIMAQKAGNSLKTQIEPSLSKHFDR